MSFDRSWMTVKIIDTDGERMKRLEGRPQDVIPELLELCKWKLNILDEILRTSIEIKPLFDSSDAFSVPANAKIDISLKRKD